MILAHSDRPLLPHDLWSAWNLDPLIAGALLVAAWASWSGYRRSRRRAGETKRFVFFALALVTLAVALLSPLDALSGVLASAHMVQHLLLTIVAAPLVALSAPSTLLRAAPPPVRRGLAHAQRTLRLTRRDTRILRHPAVAGLLYVGTLWFWHAAVPYDAALEQEAVHALSHASYLATAVLFWGVVLDTRRRRGTSPGVGILLLFVTAMQGVFLSALLTFAETSWYSGYARTTQGWGLEPLADQQLAGVIMWLPGGLIYLATALFLLVSWLRDSESAAPAPAWALSRPPSPP